MHTAHSLRERIYIVVFQTDTVAGRRFDKILLLIILAGLLISIGMFIANPYAAMWAVIGSAIGGGVALLADQAQAA